MEAMMLQGLFDELGKVAAAASAAISLAKSTTQVARPSAVASIKTPLLKAPPIKTPPPIQSQPLGDAIKSPWAPPVLR